MIRPRTFICNVVMISLIVGTFVLGCGTARADEPRMQAALEALRHAKQELELATPNKGGHRERAIEIVNRAIEEVEKGIEFGRK